MGGFWDDLRKNLRIWGSAAAEKAEELGKVAASKTEELTKISKVRLEIHQLQRDLDKTFSGMGKFVYDAASGENVTNFSGNEKFFSFVKEAEELIKQIKVKEERMEEIKKEYRKAEEAEEKADTAESGAEEPPPEGSGS
ncbi:MAG: hypothetical protein ACE5HZ_07370 [Fidelibacterota bacterium]